MHEIVSEYLNAKRERNCAYNRKIRQNPEYRERERIMNLARWHARKKAVECPLCEKSYVYIDRHKLSKKHLDREDNPLQVVAEQFKIIQPICEDLKSQREENEKLLQQTQTVIAEMDGIKSAIENGRVPPEYIKPVVIKKRVGRKIKLSST